MRLTSTGLDQSGKLDGNELADDESAADELNGSEETDRFDINDPEHLRLADLHLVFPDKLQQCKKGYHELRHAGGWAE